MSVSGSHHVHLNDAPSVAPAVTAFLDVHRTSMRPTSCVVQPLGERDLYPEAKQVHELVMEYSFKLEEDGEATPQACQPPQCHPAG